MIHSAADEVLEHLWYAVEENRAVSCVDDLHLGGVVPDDEVVDALESLRA